MTGGKKKKGGSAKGKQKKAVPPRAERRKSVTKVGSQKVATENKEVEEDEGIDIKSFESLIDLGEVQNNEEILLGTYCLSQVLIKTPVEWLKCKFFNFLGVDARSEGGRRS